MSKTESPCIRNCCLDDNDVCMGCFRTLDEIKVWSSLSDQQKREVLLQSNIRKLEDLTRRECLQQH
ncbi:MAG: DUF1289 domain-containing protein [Gammaproteobacteria bacterium]|nr:DUF1289 domain-containing protein [Gammaproteobacteria bacterium]